MDIQVEMTNEGRLTIPVKFRRELGIGRGEKVTLRKEDGALKILTQAQVLNEARAAVREFVGPDVNLVDELIAERRAEAKREEEDYQAYRKPLQ